MPRQSRSRPTARPAARSAPAPASTPAQSRGTHTAAAPPTAATTPAPAVGAGAPAQRSPGLLAQAASTMGGAVAGSVIGHGISNMIFGPRGEATPASEAVQQQAAMPVQQDGQRACNDQAENFITCIKNAPDAKDCEWFLEQMKACQARWANQ